jgi:hypothetical protein
MSFAGLHPEVQKTTCSSGACYSGSAIETTGVHCVQNGYLKGFFYLKSISKNQTSKIQ